MPWEYSQSTGELRHNGRPLGHGYSGAGAGRNNPAMEAVRSVGLIPRGRYTIGRPRQSPRTGPHAMDLTPVGHDAHRRTAFQIHGDNRTHDASTGCIILDRAIRDRIAASNDHTLNVVR